MKPLLGVCRIAFIWRGISPTRYGSTMDRDSGTDWITCPFCSRASVFRRLDIINGGVLWKCRACNRTRREELPPLRKQIVYLDQWVISNMLKAEVGRPVTRAEKWRELHGLLNHLISDQLVICPDSCYHQEESALIASLEPGLRETYRRMSRGVSFKTPDDIGMFQLYQSLRKFVGEDQLRGYTFGSSDAFYGNPHEWHARLYVTSDLSRRFLDPERTRRAREQLAEHLDEVAERNWKRRPATFDEDVAAEKAGYARGLLFQFAEACAYMTAMNEGRQEFDPGTYLDCLYRGREVLWMTEYLAEKLGDDGYRGLRHLLAFFASPHFGATPFLQIMAKLYAAMARHVRGPGRKPKPSDSVDVNVCSYFLPYCDAMVLDRAFAAITREGPLRLHEVYDTKVFGMQDFGGFLDYLVQIGRDPQRAQTRALYESLDHRSVF